MADKFKYDVKREHLGDKPYVTGDERELTEADAARLVRLGVLVKKADPKPANKAVRAAPKNKAE